MEVVVKREGRKEREVRGMEGEEVRGMEGERRGGRGEKRREREKNRD